MQLDPIRPTLKAPGTKRLNLKYDELLSEVAFKFNVRRYNSVQIAQSSDGMEFSCGACPTGFEGKARLNSLDTSSNAFRTHVCYS